jgi:hypothetical protein
METASIASLPNRSGELIASPKTAAQISSCASLQTNGIHFDHDTGLIDPGAAG